jgi:hypothetical protein
MADNLRGVESIYRVVQSLNDELLSNPFCNTVTLGEITETDLAKQTIFPLANIIMNSVTHNENSLSFDITIVNVDIVEVSKEPIENKLYGNDNLLYIYTNQLYVINRLLGRLKSGLIYLNLEDSPRFFSISLFPFILFFFVFFLN